MPASVGLFKKYLNPVFIETGSYYGEGIWHALNAGFKEIYSIEIKLEFFNICSGMFAGYNNIHLILGDSPIVLNEILNNINEPITFWLDAHIGDVISPLLEELEAIQRHPIKTHTILIDDLREWCVLRNRFNTDILKEKILLINENYKFSFEDGFIPNDILVAYVDG